MKLSDYTLPSEGVDWERVFGAWSWLSLPDELEVWLITRFANLFCAFPDGSIHWLNPENGTLSPVAESRDAFASQADTNRNFDLWFLSQLVDELRGQLPPLQAGQCYGFHTPPGFREGKYAASNAKLADVTDYLIAMGQLWGRLQDQPDGTSIRLKTT